MRRRQPARPRAGPTGTKRRGAENANPGSRIVVGGHAPRRQEDRGMTSADRHKRQARGRHLPGNLAELRLWEISWANPAAMLAAHGLSRAETGPIRPPDASVKVQGARRATYHS